MEKSDDKKYESKSSKDSYTPNYHFTWGGIIISFLVGFIVIFLSIYLKN